MFWYYSCLAIDAVNFNKRTYTFQEQFALEKTAYEKLCDVFNLGFAKSKKDWEKAGWPS
jgi:hypothetical protein